MRRIRVALPLAVIQVIVAAVLLAIGQRQAPRAPQDAPFSVGPAIEVSLAINAPVTFLGGCLLVLFHGVGIEFNSKTVLLLCYFSGTFVLWFLAGLETESRLRNGTALRRVVTDGLAITLGVGLLYFAFAVWRLDEKTVALGSAIWALGLVTVYSLDFVRFLGPRRTAQ